MNMTALRRKELFLEGNLHASPLAAELFRVARTLNLKGWIQAHPRGLAMELEGDEATLRAFEKRVAGQQSTSDWSFETHSKWLPFKGEGSLHHRLATQAPHAGIWLRPDRAPCADCVSEILNPHQRRFFYPFTSCGACGPRYSWARHGLMERSDTVLSNMEPCEQCQAEIEQSRDRRFLHHLNLCGTCGPSLKLRNPMGSVVAQHRESLIQAAALLENEGVIVVQEPHGHSLLGLARSNEALGRMRNLLQEPFQPATLIMATADAVDTYAQLHSMEQEAMQTPAAPLIRVRRRAVASSLAKQLCPASAFLHVGLPASGLMHLLLKLLDLPLAAFFIGPPWLPYAATQLDIRERFQGEVDGMLTSSLPLRRPTDRSLLWQVGESLQVLQHGFGMVPVEMRLPEDPSCVLAMGGARSTALLAMDKGRAFLGPALNDLRDGVGVMDYFFDGLADTRERHALEPNQLLVDADASCLSSQYARSTGKPLVFVDHDLAHVMASLGQARPAHRWLGLCFDEGSAPKGQTSSGGEILWIDPKGWDRVAQWLPFWLPGGDACGSDNRGCLLGMMWELYHTSMWEQLPIRLRASLQPTQIQQWQAILESKLQCRRTRSLTRWWQGITALLTSSHRNRFEGDSWMILDALSASLSRTTRSDTAYPWILQSSTDQDQPIGIDWHQMLAGMLEDLGAGRGADLVLCRLLETFAEMIVRVVRALEPDGVVLAGNGFENRLLTSALMERLGHLNIPVVMSETVPLDDAGLGMGQMLAHAGGYAAGITQRPELREKLLKACSENLCKTPQQPPDPV
ncbi:MAG: hypothetical protein EBU26_06870 [Verrucomicrobia bacterium]|nr:hypothetical protein [Verrucomicrobiota bacterium]